MREGKHMIGDWIADGLLFGIGAFFAVAMFMALLLAVAGLIAVVSGIFGGGEGDDDDLPGD